MRKRSRVIGKGVTAAVAAAMIFQGTAMAAPIDELDEILEKQEAMASESLMEKELGLSDLGEAIKENGLLFQMKAGLAGGTTDTLGIEDERLENGYVNVGLQVNPDQEAWSLTAGASDGTSSILDLLLYGTRDQLALSIPQLFTGAVAISSGNLKEQYENSALSEMLGEGANLPDIDLAFYPDEDGIGEIENPLQEMKEEIEEKAEELKDSLQVEKDEDGDTIIYRASCETAEVMEIYGIVMKDYMSLFTESPLAVSVNDFQDYEAEIDEVLEQLGSVMGDEITIEFLVRDDLVQEIRYEVYCDTTALNDGQEVMTEVVEEELAPAGNAEDAVPAEEAEAADAVAASVIGGADGSTDITIEAEDFQGYIFYDFIFNDPADINSGISVYMDITDTDQNEIGTFYMDWTRTREDLVESYMLYLSITEEGETIYSDIPVYATFDRETGDFDLTLSMQDDEEQAVSLILDSTFSQIEKGKGFTLTVDGLSLVNDGECVGLTSEIQVSAEPGEIQAPGDIKNIFQLSQTDILSLIQEINVKGEAWSAQLEGEGEL